MTQSKAAKNLVCSSPALQIKNTSLSSLLDLLVPLPERHLSAKPMFLGHAQSQFDSCPPSERSIFYGIQNKDPR